MSFLRTRRSKVAPEQAGIPGGGRRRVPGLRREEVALLANVSVDYYARLERGDLAGVSDEILDAVAGTLQLDEAETLYLFDLARAARRQPASRRRPPAKSHVRSSLQRLLDAITGAPAWVRNERMDFVALNALGRALYAPALQRSGNPPNNARFLFLDSAAREFYPNWGKNMDDVVATLRGYAGRSPHNKDLTDLVGELATLSDDFRIRWAARDVRFHRTGVKRIHHPVVGDLEFEYEALDLPSNPGWTMFVYTTAPGSASEERLNLLASWAATDAQAQTRSGSALGTE